MKPIMPEIIYKSQNVFVPGRLILQLWHLKPCILWKEFWRSINEGVATKLDISKVYDSIEWLFFRFVLTELGFAQ